RHAQAEVAVVIVGVCRPVQIRLVERDAPYRVGADALVLQLVEVVPLLILLIRAKSAASEEPEFVPHDRSAERAARVVVLLERRRETQASRAQAVIEVVRLE